MDHSSSSITRSPRAAAALKQLPERNRFFKGLASWIGFRQIRVDYEPDARAHGVTTFSPTRLIGLSIEGLTSFSVAPLRFASLLGVLLATMAFLFGLSILWEVLTTGKQVPGYPSLVIGLMNFAVPLQLGVRVAVASAEGPPALLEAADIVVDGPSAMLELLRLL